MARNIFFILITLTFFSCSDIFSTRDPDDPDSDINPNTAESASELVFNFENSLSELDVNKYESIFSTLVTTGYEFRFISEASDVLVPGVFDDWKIENEKAFLNALLNDGKSFSDMSLSTDPIDETADSLELNLNYSMKLNSVSDTITVKGSFIFDLIKTDGHFWYLRTWKDISFENYSSFSSLKEPFAY